MLSFTAQEVWETIARQPKASVFEQTWYDSDAGRCGAVALALAEAARACARDVLKLLEDVARRREKSVHRLPARSTCMRTARKRAMLQIVRRRFAVRFHNFAVAIVHEGRHETAGAVVLDVHRIKSNRARSASASGAGIIAATSAWIRHILISAGAASRICTAAARCASTHDVSWLALAAVVVVIDQLTKLGDHANRFRIRRRHRNHAVFQPGARA